MIHICLHDGRTFSKWNNNKKEKKNQQKRRKKRCVNKFSHIKFQLGCCGAQRLPNSHGYSRRAFYFCAVFSSMCIRLCVCVCRVGCRLLATISPCNRATIYIIFLNRCGYRAHTVCERRKKKGPMIRQLDYPHGNHFFCLFVCAAKQRTLVKFFYVYTLFSMAIFCIKSGKI